MNHNKKSAYSSLTSALFPMKTELQKHSEQSHETSVKAHKVRETGWI